MQLVATDGDTTARGTTSRSRLHRWVAGGIAAAGLAATLLTTTVAPAQAAGAATTTTTTSAQTELIHTTANHPWLTSDRGWVQAGDLKPGEAVVTLDGASSTVVWVHIVPGQADMYNLTVANDHTYAVGTGQYVVHNIDPNPLTPRYWKNWLLPGVRWERNATEGYPTVLRAPDWETAVAQASRLAGFEPTAEYEPIGNRVHIDPEDPSRLAEWRGVRGADINMDAAHLSDPDRIKAHDDFHVGWRQSGNRPELESDPEARSLFSGNITVDDPDSAWPPCLN